MATSQIIYTGDLRTECTHLQSGSKITTDAPTDNNGKGEYFSPTDLVATALGACVITTLGIFGKKENRNWDFTNTRIECTKIMSTNPRRIGKIEIHIYFGPNNFTDQEKTIIERVSKSCPVWISLHPDVIVEEIFYYN